MAIYGLDQVSSKATQVASTASKDVMGKDDFLKLLVAQLQSQDPMNPMDGTDFTAQLAQFSSLEQLQNINSSLGSVGTSQSVLTNSQAVGFIGKTITAIGDSIPVSNGQSQNLQFSLDKDAAGLYATIRDQSGNTVRQIEIGPTKAGPQTISWDGQDYQGHLVSDGNYTFNVAAMDAQGNSVPVTKFATGVVTGVSFKDGLAYLQCGDVEIPMGNVVQVLPTSESE